jgi:hypothetical protein
MLLGALLKPPVVVPLLAVLPVVLAATATVPDSEL